MPYREMTPFSPYVTGSVCACVCEGGGGGGGMVM